MILNHLKIHMESYTQSEKAIAQNSSESDVPLGAFFSMFEERSPSFSDKGGLLNTNSDITRSNMQNDRSRGEILSRIKREMKDSIMKIQDAFGGDNNSEDEFLDFNMKSNAGYDKSGKNNISQSFNRRKFIDLGETINKSTSSLEERVKAISTHTVIHKMSDKNSEYGINERDLERNEISDDYTAQANREDLSSIKNRAIRHMLADLRARKRDLTRRSADMSHNEGNVSDKINKIPSGYPVPPPPIMPPEAKIGERSSAKLGPTTINKFGKEHSGIGISEDNGGQSLYDLKRKTAFNGKISRFTHLRIINEEDTIKNTGNPGGFGGKRLKADDSSGEIRTSNVAGKAVNGYTGMDYNNNRNTADIDFRRSGFMKRKFMREIEHIQRNQFDPVKNTINPARGIRFAPSGSLDGGIASGVHGEGFMDSHSVNMNYGGRRFDARERFGSTGGIRSNLYSEDAYFEQGTRPINFPRYDNNVQHDRQMGRVSGDYPSSGFVNQRYGPYDGSYLVNDYRHDAVFGGMHYGGFSAPMANAAPAAPGSYGMNMEQDSAAFGAYPGPIPDGGYYNGPGISDSRARDIYSGNANPLAQDAEMKRLNYMRLMRSEYRDYGRPNTMGDMKGDLTPNGNRIEGNGGIGSDISPITPPAHSTPILSKIKKPRLRPLINSDETLRKDYIVNSLTALKKSEPVKYEILNMLKGGALTDLELIRHLKRTRYIGMVTFGMMMYSLIEIFGEDMIKKESTESGHYIYSLSDSMKNLLENLQKTDE